MALLLGNGLVRAEKRYELSLLRLHRLAAAIGALACCVLSVALYMSFHAAAAQNVVALDTKLQPADNHNYSMGLLLDFDWHTFQTLRTPLLLAVVCVSAALIGAFLLRRAQRHVLGNVAMALGMVGFFFAANMSYTILEPQLSSKALADIVNKTAQPGSKLVLYGDIRTGASLAFYTHRRVWLFHAGGSNLEYGSHWPDAPKVFLTDKDFPPFWNQPAQVFMMVPDEQAGNFLKAIPADCTWLLARYGGKSISHEPRTTCRNRPRGVGPT